MKVEYMRIHLLKEAISSQGPRKTFTIRSGQDSRSLMGTTLLTAEISGLSTYIGDNLQTDRMSTRLALTH
jgi:hypothetical protein